MVPTELFVVSVLRALVEVAGLFLLGQGVLYLLAGARREKMRFISFSRLLPARSSAWFVTSPRA
jgi:hypothetical protein